MQRSAGGIGGIIPAGGSARRVHNYAKELIPIGSADHDPTRFIVCSEEVVERVSVAGVDSIRFVINPAKSYLFEYYARNDLLMNGLLSFSSVGPAEVQGGMPYTIASQREYLHRYDTILMGMPDTVIDPADAFKRLLDLHQQLAADLTLGLFHANDRNPGGYILADKKTHLVHRHVDKTSARYPADANNAWAIAAWSTQFTRLLCDIVDERDVNPSEELLFGDIIDAAVDNQHLRVVADLIDPENGFYWDIADPEKYFELLQSGRRGGPGSCGALGQRVPPSSHVARRKSGRPEQPSFFISYSSVDRSYAENLKALLGAYGAETHIDTVDIGSGPIDDQIGRMIQESSSFVLLLSQSSLQSEWVQAELSHVRFSPGYRVHVVMLEEITEDESRKLGRFGRSQHNWIDATDGTIEKVADELLAHRAV
jgi:glucose-1-phosphate thymidylyltransferase